MTTIEMATELMKYPDRMYYSRQYNQYAFMCNGFVVANTEKRNSPHQHPIYFSKKYIELYDWQQVEGRIVEVDFLTALESNRPIRPVEDDTFKGYHPPSTWLFLLSKRIAYEEDEKTAKNHENMMRLIKGKWEIKNGGDDGNGNY